MCPSIRHMANAAHNHKALGNGPGALDLKRASDCQSNHHPSTKLTHGSPLVPQTPTIITLPSHLTHPNSQSTPLPPPRAHNPCRRGCLPKASSYPPGRWLCMRTRGRTVPPSCTHTPRGAALAVRATNNHDVDLSHRLMMSVAAATAPSSCLRASPSDAARVRNALNMMRGRIDGLVNDLV